MRTEKRGWKHRYCRIGRSSALALVVTARPDPLPGSRLCHSGDEMFLSSYYAPYRKPLKTGDSIGGTVKLVVGESYTTHE